MIGGAQSSLKTIDKATRLLQAFSHERSELSIGELSRELKLHKSVVSRIVGALRRGRLLEQDPTTRRVRVGVEAFRLGSIFTNRQNIVQTVMPFLGMLVARTSQSAHAVVLDGTRGFVVATVESPSALRVITRVGEHRHLHATAAGKVFLAFSDESLLNAAAQDPGLVALTSTTITDVKKLKAQLQAIRRSRIAWNSGESHAGVGGVATPVLGEGGHIIAAIASVFPLNAVSDKQQRNLAKETLQICQQVSEQFRSIKRAR